MNERLRIPQDDEYFQAVGLAAIAFARLEWNAVWCCEKLQSGYIRSIEEKRKTAGKIAEDLKQLFSQVSDKTLLAKIEPFAEEFREVAKERNALFHAKPGTSNNREQRLFREGVEWSISAVNAFSDRCVSASMPLNALLHNEFADVGSVKLKS